MYLENTNGYHVYYIYILTNKYRTTLYIGVTNNLRRRLQEHIESVNQGTGSFVGRYKLSSLVYYERFTWIQEAIAREKELKRWRRDKKNDLIRSLNPMHEDLNHHFD